MAALQPPKVAENFKSRNSVTLYESQRACVNFRQAYIDVGVWTLVILTSPYCSFHSEVRS